MVLVERMKIRHKVSALKVQYCSQVRLKISASKIYSKTNKGPYYLL